MSESRRSSVAGSVVSSAFLKTKIGTTTVVSPGSFSAQERHYPRVANASLHPTVSQFLGLTRDQIIARYCAVHVGVSPAALRALLAHTPSHFKWGGCDLFVVGPVRRCVVVETNSCPSGQKSVPYVDGDELNGYGRLLRGAFASLTKGTTSADGVLAVLYDKNVMEAGGYASALAELTGEDVYLCESFLTDPDPPIRWDAVGRLSVRAPSGHWLPARAALRYVTQKPWSRLPIVPTTPLLNPLLPCLGGGRNKMLAARAYMALNAKLDAAGAGLELKTPATVGDVEKSDVAGIIARMGGCAVVKVPYGNAGQGVYTITSPAELAAFQAESHRYEKFIVQQLVGGPEWGHARSDGGAAAPVAAPAATTAAAANSESRGERPPRPTAAAGKGKAAPEAPPFEHMYHLGTVPNKRGETFVFDMRMMVAADDDGFAPVAVYARRALEPLSRLPPPPSAVSGGPSASWLQLGTNLSRLTDDLTWTTESERLIIADVRDFPALGVSVDDLIDGFVQSVLAMTAIDDMCAKLLTPSGSFDIDAFEALNDDAALVDELRAQSLAFSRAASPTEAF